MRIVRVLCVILVLIAAVWIIWGGIGYASATPLAGVGTEFVC